MSDDSRSPDEPVSSDGSDQIDEALGLAFGRRARESDDDSANLLDSALISLEKRTGSVLRVHLPEAQAEQDPVVKIEPGVGGINKLGSSRYQILGELARGGVGVIYKGRDTDLGRDVALKVLHERLKANHDVLQRFVEEAQIGGQLQHPGIVPVYELGLQADDRPFFVMKLVKGQTLAALLQKREGSAEESRRFLQIFEQVCQTVAYAHARSVVHRDLKPSNVMVGAFGEVQVVDWGFAKVMQRGGIADEKRPAPKPEVSVIETVRSREGSSHSQAGSVFGTPAYMPPEQAQGDVDRLDERSDVFSLGAVLCEILTGNPPYTSEDGEDILGLAADCGTEPAWQRLDACGADAALVKLAKRCLSGSRKARPQDAGVLAKRISAWLVSVEERAHAAELTAAEAKVRATSERKARRLTVALAATILLAGSGYVWIEREQAVRLKETARIVRADMQEAKKLEGQAKEASSLAYWKDAVAAAGRAEARASDGDPELRGEVSTLLASLRSGLAKAQKTAARVDRDRRMLETLVRLQIPVDDDMRERMWLSRELLRLDNAYGEAFKQYDVDVDALSVEDAAVKLEGDTQVRLAAALDHWATVRNSLTTRSVESWQRLLQLAGLLDQDPWRQEFRRIISTQPPDVDEMKKLAARADYAKLPAASILLLGTGLRGWGELPAAITVFKAGASEHPDDFAIHFYLGWAHERMDPPHWDAAVSAYRIALAIEPQMKEVRHRLGMALFESKKFEAAMKVFEFLLRGDPNNAHWHLHRGDVFGRKEEWNSAINAYREALEHQPKHTEARDRLAKVHWLSGDREEAIKTWLEAVRYEPRHGEAHEGLCMAFREKGELEKAIRHGRAAVRYLPRSADAHYRLAKALDIAGKDQEAIEFLEKALAIDPDHTFANNTLGTSYFKRGEFDRALVLFQKSVDVDPKQAQAWSNLGGTLVQQAYLQKGDVGKAIKALRTAIDLDPKLHDAHFNLGNAYFVRGEIDDAIAWYRKAIKLKPKHWFSYYRLAASLKQKGDLDGAIAQLKKSLALNPRDHDIWFQLGLVYDRKKALDDAIDAYRKAIQLHGAFAKAHDSLGRALRQQGKFEAALASCREAIRHKRDYAEAWCGAGLALQDLGRYGESLKALRHGHELGAWPELSARWLKNAQRLAEAEERLLAIMRGKLTADSPAERLEAALLAYRRKWFGASARLYAEALAADPSLARDIVKWHRYNAACAAALAGCGPGQDGEKLDDAGRSRWRRQALAWLREDLQHLSSLLKKGQDKDKDQVEKIAKMLAHWLRDPDFAGVRDSAALAELPEQEAGAWRELWSQVKALQRRIR